MFCFVTYRVQSDVIQTCFLVHFGHHLRSTSIKKIKRTNEIVRNNQFAGILIENKLEKSVSETR